MIPLTAYSNIFKTLLLRYHKHGPNCFEESNVLHGQTTSKVFSPLAKQPCQHIQYYILMQKHKRLSKWENGRKIQSSNILFQSLQAGSMVVYLSFMVVCLLVDYVKASCKAWEEGCSSSELQNSNFFHWKRGPWHFLTPSKHRAKDFSGAKFR